MENLSDKKCIPCEGGVPPLSKNECLKLKASLNPRWEITQDFKRLKSTLVFKDYKKAWDVLNDISKIAEEEWHHPILELSFGKLNIDLFTHKINGLQESDFILAAKIDQVLLGEVPK